MGIQSEKLEATFEVLFVKFVTERIDYLVLGE
jgi:hypothetical protein